MSNYTVEEILTMPEKEQSRICIFYNDCSICPLALVKETRGKTKFMCAGGLKKERLERELEEGAFLMGGIK